MPSDTPIFRRFLCFLPPLALAACAPVGPDHETPAMKLPASFSQGGMNWKRQTPGSQPTPRSWWKLYQDPTLTALVERSLAGNQDLAAAAARLDQARALSQAARSSYFPMIDLGSRASRTKSVFRGPQGGSILLNAFSIPVDINYEFDTWGQVSREVESAGASESAARETLNALRLTVAGEVAQTYWALRAVDADRVSLARTLEIRRKALDLLTKRRDAGTISGLDLSRAETEVATAEADRIRLDQERVPLVHALAVLAGTAATGASIPEKSELPKPPGVPVSVPSELLRQRPDIRAAEHRVAAANAEIGVATAAFYPSFSINASGGLDSIELKNLIDPTALVWSIGANALLPITGQKLLRHRRDATVAAHLATSAEYRQIVLNSIREVEDALQGAAILVRREKAQDEALASATKTFDLSVKRFNSGLVSFLDVVDAERTRLDAERNANAIRAERLAVSVALIKALGGEW